jgi:methionine synthase II (cobalamin-independent)
MKAEYETIVAAGIDLQLDCPDLALSRHMLFADLSDEEFVKIATLHVEALNHALRDIDSAHVRVHICWGNYEGPHVCDIDMDKVFSTLMQTRRVTSSSRLQTRVMPMNGPSFVIAAQRYPTIKFWFREWLIPRRILSNIPNWLPNG